ncbi:MAG TPA: SLATT domain-containing protein [Streptosporangiaceae bacterium]|nr:SLATT domain-containing protein [Streptosporangiaceae bacterium]
MRWLRSDDTRDEIDSEKGFLFVAGEAADMPLRDIFLKFRKTVSGDMEWADSRKHVFRRRASYVRVATLLLTAASTVVLGIEAIPSRAAIALPMVALVTVLGQLDSFYNWRSRWVLMEEAQYRLNRLRDDIDYYVITTPPPELEEERLKKFFLEQQATWNDVSRRWIGFRKVGNPPQGEQASPNIVVT